MNRSLNISEVAHARLAQKKECWTWKEVHWFNIFTWGETFCSRYFFISRSKASDANIVIIANFF